MESIKKNIYGLIFFVAIILWAIPQVRAAQAMNILTKEEIQKSVTASIYSRLGLETGNGKVQIVFRNLKKRKLPVAGPVTLSVKAMNESKLHGVVRFSIEVLKEKRFVERFSVTTEVRTFEDLVVTTGKIKKHEKISLDKVELKRIETTKLRREYFTDIKSFSGCRSKRVISGKRIITPADLEHVPVINKGDKITIVCQGRGVRVTARGVALRDGVIGEKIPVKNLSGGARLIAQVIEAGKVSVGY